MCSEHRNHNQRALRPIGDSAERLRMKKMPSQVADMLSAPLGMRHQEPNDHRPLRPSKWDYGVLASQWGPFLVGVGTCAGAILAWLQYGARLWP
jgi:hypothetical protein